MAPGLPHSLDADVPPGDHTESSGAPPRPVSAAPDPRPFVPGPRPAAPSPASLPSAPAPEPPHTSEAPAPALPDAAPESGPTTALPDPAVPLPNPARTATAEAEATEAPRTPRLDDAPSRALAPTPPPGTETPADGFSDGDPEAEKAAASSPPLDRAKAPSDAFEDVLQRDVPDDLPATGGAEVSPERVAGPDLRPEGIAFARETTALRAAIRTVAPIAWADLLVEQLDPQPGETPGWATLDLDLGEGEGRLSVSARQDEGRLVVAVQLTDPSVRAAAQQQADQIRARLEQHYGTAVDLSFSQGDEGRQPAHGGPREAAGVRSAPSPARSTTPSAPTPRAPSARQEWIG